MVSFFLFDNKLIISHSSFFSLAFQWFFPSSSYFSLSFLTFLICFIFVEMVAMGKKQNMVQVASLSRFLLHSIIKVSSFYYITIMKFFAASPSTLFLATIR
jgi:hypothetical protein